MVSHQPRTRSPLPPPLRIRSPPHTHIPSSANSPTTLLYDLPQSSSARSPPPESSDRLLYSPPRKSQPLDSPHRKPNQTPSPRLRASTPGHELEQFNTYCHAWYFNQDEQAGRMMNQIMESLDPSQRAPYTRVQSSTRSAYHTFMAKRRRSEFRAHVSSSIAGGSLSPNARMNPSGKLAKKERYERFCRFLRTWCTTGMPGPRPFFQALWAVMRLQALPSDLGGAGGLRVEWEIDDAVFQESAGKEFMLEAIDILKGVLGFEEYLPPSSRSVTPTQDATTPLTTSIPTARILNKRPRSPSDPFLDTPGLSHSLTTSASTTSSNNLDPPPADDSVQVPTSAAPSDYDEPYLRVWITAELSNPELQSLISLFPSFIVGQALPRFTSPNGKTRNGSIRTDLEMGPDTSEERREVTCGTGRIWIGSKLRPAGWRGGWWQRFAGFWRRLFGC